MEENYKDENASINAYHSKSREGEKLCLLKLMHIFKMRVLECTSRIMNYIEGHMQMTAIFTKLNLMFIIYVYEAIIT